MATIAVEDVRDRLAELIANLTPGEGLLVTRGGTPVARIVAEPKSPRAARKAGSAKGQLVILAEDDEHLSHFAGYTG